MPHTRCDVDAHTLSIKLAPYSTFLYLDGQTKIQLFEILRSLEAVPGVQIETGAEVKTPAIMRMPDEDEDMADVDQRATGTNASRASWHHLDA